MRLGFSSEEYAHAAKMARIIWNRTDDEEQTWRQKLEMLLANLLEDEAQLEQAMEDSRALRRSLLELEADLAAPPDPVATPVPKQLYRKPPKPDPGVIESGEPVPEFVTTLAEVEDLLSRDE